MDLCERFADVEFTDVVRQLGATRRTGALRVQGHPDGVVFLQDGVVVGAACSADGDADRHATVTECLLELSRSPGLLEFSAEERSPRPRESARGVEVVEVLPLIMADRSLRAAAGDLVGRLSLAGELTGDVPGVYIGADDWRWLVACVNGADLHSFARDFRIPSAAVADWAARMVSAGIAVRDTAPSAAGGPPLVLGAGSSTALAARNPPPPTVPRQASMVEAILGRSRTATDAPLTLVPHPPDDSRAAVDVLPVRPDAGVVRREPGGRPLAPAKVVGPGQDAPLAHPRQAAPAAVAGGGTTSPFVVKVVVAGAFAAGKTTFISALSEIPGLASETVVTDESASIKTRTTVAMDFGRIVVPAVGGEPAIELSLFGTPGQQRFDFMWDIAARGMAGLVLLVDASAPATWDDSRRILTYFQKASDAPVTIGMNRCEQGTDVADALAAHLGLASTRTLVPCQASDRESAKAVLLNLILQLAGGHR